MSTTPPLTASQGAERREHGAALGGGVTSEDKVCYSCCINRRALTIRISSFVVLKKARRCWWWMGSFFFVSFLCRPPPPLSPPPPAPARSQRAGQQGWGLPRPAPLTHLGPLRTPAAPGGATFPPRSPRRPPPGSTAPRRGHWLPGAVSQRAHPARPAGGFPDRERGETIPAAEELQLPACPASGRLPQTAGSGQRGVCWVV